MHPSRRPQLVETTLHVRQGCRHCSSHVTRIRWGLDVAQTLRPSCPRLCFFASPPLHFSTSPVLRFATYLLFSFVSSFLFPYLPSQLFSSLSTLSSLFSLNISPLWEDVTNEEKIAVEGDGTSFVCEAFLSRRLARVPCDAVRAPAIS